MNHNNDSTDSLIINGFPSTYNINNKKSKKFNKALIIISVCMLILIFLMLLMMNILFLSTIIKISEYVTVAPGSIKNFLDTYSLKVTLSL